MAESGDKEVENIMLYNKFNERANAAIKDLLLADLNVFCYKKVHPFEVTNLFIQTQKDISSEDLNEIPFRGHGQFSIREEGMPDGDYRVSTFDFQGIALLADDKVTKISDSVITLHLI